MFSFLVKWKLRYPEECVPDNSFNEHFLHIFLKAENQEVIILCKLYVVLLYVYQSKESLGNYVISLGTLDEMK